MASGARIITTHAGSLPRPQRLIALEARRAAGEAPRRGRPRTRARGGRRRGRRAPARGGHRRRQRRRVRPLERGGLRLRRLAALRLRAPRRARAGERGRRATATPASGEVVLAPMSERRDWVRFAGAYGDPHSGVALPAWSADRSLAGRARADHLQRPGGDRARHRERQGGARGGRAHRGRLPERGRRRPAARASPTSTTRPTRSCSTPARTRCARSTRRSSTPA